MNPTLQKLKGKNQITFVTEDSKYGKLEWVIKPIPFTLLLENFDKFGTLPNEKEVMEGKLNQEQAKKLQLNIYPMIKAIVPKCIVAPKITDDEELANAPDSEYLHIDDIPFSSLVDIFNKIIEETGLDKMGEDARKKLQPAQSPSQ